MNSSLSDIKNTLDSQKGFKGWLKRLFFRILQSEFETLANSIDDCKNNISETEKISSKNSSVLRRDLETVSENLRNNNTLIERLCSDSELLKLKVSGLERNSSSIPKSVEIPNITHRNEAVSDESDYYSIDYFDFENHFRGSIDSIKKSQEFYLKYFHGKKHVLDIGCGRGEFLSLMKDNGIDAEGVDIYQPYVDYCRMNGLSASCGDGTDYLSEMESVDGIFVGQVVEHLKTSDIIRLCNTACEKLSEGGCLVIETPNPTSLSIYTNAFYIDPSHIKPVHPLTMQYLLEKAGFRNTEIIYTKQSRPPVEIPPLHIENGVENTDEFNKAMKTVSDMIFGSQDYAVIAIK